MDRIVIVCGNCQAEYEAELANMFCQKCGQRLPGLPPIKLTPTGENILAVADAKAKANNAKTKADATQTTREGRAAYDLIRRTARDRANEILKEAEAKANQALVDSESKAQKILSDAKTAIEANMAIAKTEAERIGRLSSVVTPAIVAPVAPTPAPAPVASPAIEPAPTSADEPDLSVEPDSASPTPDSEAPADEEEPEEVIDLAEPADEPVALVDETLASAAVIVIPVAPPAPVIVIPDATLPAQHKGRLRRIWDGEI